jgi:hypothetical protein
MNKKTDNIEYDVSSKLKEVNFSWEFTEENLKVILSNELSALSQELESTFENDPNTFVNEGLSKDDYLICDMLIIEKLKDLIELVQKRDTSVYGH